jgi:hypothetical protein
VGRRHIAMDTRCQRMTTSALLSVFQVVISAAAGLIALRLYRSRLHRRYPALFSYMAFQAVYSLCPVVLDVRASAYFWSWTFAEPTQWALEILLVRELCHVVLERYRGLVSLGRWVMYIGVAVAALLSLLALLPHIRSTMPARSKVIGYWMAADRGISLSLVIFLLLMLLAVSRYPVRLSRNVILNAALFTFCFTCDSLGAVVRTVFDVRLSPSVNVILSGIAASCFVTWLSCLTPEGEHVHFDWIRFAPEYEGHALARLDALNRALQKSVE